jgi:hypothetical protein
VAQSDMVWIGALLTKKMRVMSWRSQCLGYSGLQIRQYFQRLVFQMAFALRWKQGGCSPYGDGVESAGKQRVGRRSVQPLRVRDRRTVSPALEERLNPGEPLWFPKGIPRVLGELLFSGRARRQGLRLRRGRRELMAMWDQCARVAPDYEGRAKSVTVNHSSLESREHPSRPAEV